jgi:hypothetical protein
MKNIAIISIICFALLACKENTVPASTSTPSTSAASTSAASTPVSTAPEAAPSEPAPVTAESFSFPFTAVDTTKAEADPRFVKWEESPCGTSPVMKLSDMPLNDDIIKPDFVLEFDNAGKEINRWGKPYNSEMGYLKEDHISFMHSNDAGEALEYSTDSHGNIKLETSANKTESNIAKGKSIKCPVFEVFGKDSGYLQCFEVIDPSNNKTRRIAFEAACS